MGICLFHSSRRQSERLDGFELILVIRYQIFQWVVSPSIDLINRYTDGMFITYLNSLDGVAFLPGIFIERDVVLYPRVARIGEG